MTLWIILALMTSAAALAVLWPLLRKPSAAAAAHGNDLEVYRDQLEEIERDRAAGLIGGPEAEAARIEVSRRLIAAADAAGIPAPARNRKPRPGKRTGTAIQATRPPNSAQTRRRRLAAAITVVLPLGAGALYLTLGSPDFPDQPLASRMAAGNNGDEAVQAAFARVEAHLQDIPEDGRGWEVIAPVYMRLGRYEDAVKARTNALRLLGVTAQREADLGEALVAAANGIVTTEAKAAFDEAIRLDPTEVSARFYQGLAAEQDGNPTEAARLWRALLADAPQNAPWSSSVSRALARVEPGTGEKAPSKAAGQSGDVPAGQDQMIRGMVERLAARLQQDGSDVEGWLRLVRSYTVLGDAERERAATADARAALANDPEKLRRLDAGLRDLAAGAAAPPASSTPDVRNATTATIPPEHEPMTMVDRLAARLQRDGSDLDGWLMLVRSNKVLGETDRAREAVVDARRALAEEPDKLRGLEEGVKKLGVDGFER